MKKCFFTACLLLATLLIKAQSLPCSNPVYRQFDFWLGEWEAFNVSGNKAGDSKISVMLDSCIILEEWTSTAVTNGLHYAGKSYNTYNAAKQKWQQYWVDNTGGVTEYFNGRFVNGVMILETDNIKQADSTNKIMKMTFTKLAADKVRQHGESSTDNGKTWKTDFDLEYRRKK
ncbi:MAG: hypothetical protein QM791_17330 [Ferruginibacter sp.]